MKLQFDEAGLRIRVSRSEFAALRSGVALAADLEWPAMPWRLSVRSGAQLAVRHEHGRVVLDLPDADLAALAGRLPARDGLRYPLDLPAGPVEVRFEVDFHDGRGRPR
ncbi:hypothetical protein [Lysobacter xanthus]